MTDVDQELTLCLMTTLLVMSPAAALADDVDSDSDASIVGSWEATSVLEPSGEVAPGLFTFHRDRTWIASANEVSLSNAHGAWKPTGPGTFTATSKGFVFGPDGSAGLVLKNRVSLTLSGDGDSFTAVFSTEVSLFDGTVVDSFTGTATGTRIEVEPL